jgi:hypothetical protein
MSLLKTTTMNEAKILQFPIIKNPQGNLTFIEQEKHIPFEIKRVCWFYDVPGGETHRGYATKTQQELVVALSGSMDVVVNNGTAEHRFHMNRSFFGLCIPRGLWRHLCNFSTNSVALVLSSASFDDKDFIRDFKEYKAHMEG